MVTRSIETRSCSKGTVSSTLRDILTPEVIGVPSRYTMRKALERMRQAKISSVVVLSRDKPVGILTERGVIAALAQHGKALLSMKAGDLMSSPVLTAPPDMPVHRAFSMLLGRGFRHLVVVDPAGKALGMVTQTNVVENLGVEYFVEIKRVGQIMAREVASVPTTATMRQTLDIMARGPFSCVVAEEGGSPVGIVTERDMVTLIAREHDPDAVLVGSVMSSPVTGVREDEAVHQAAAVMREKKIRRLLVTDEAGNPVGMLTQSDLVKGMEARYVEMLKEVIREKDDLLREAVSEAAKKTVYLDAVLNTSMDTGIAATDGGTIAFVNQAAQSILGTRESEAIGRDLFEFHKALGVSPRRVRHSLAQARRGGQHRFNAAIERGGAKRYVDGRVNAIKGDGGKPTGYVLTLRDVTERRMAEEAIRRMAYHDPLTGLPNRFLVSDRLDQGLSQAKRRGSLLAVVLLDLDGFKTINDSLGHNTGDLLLRSVAMNIESVLRKSDTVGRMGGDEFLVVLPEVKTPEGAASVASKILKTVRKPCAVDGHDITVSTSIGIALYPWDGTDAQTLVRKADMAMYKAKEAGKDTYRFAREDMDAAGLKHS